MLDQFWQDHLSLLACPECHREFSVTGTGLACEGCRALWPVAEGFPEFLLESSYQTRFYDDEYWGRQSANGVTPLDRFYCRVVGSWLEKLGVGPGSKYLDVSCGEGHTLSEGAKRGATALGIEFSRTALRTSRAKFGTPAGLLANAARLPFVCRTFDRISCLGSLEHYPDPHVVLAEISRVAAPDARFLFVVPNRKHILLRLLAHVDHQKLETILDARGWMRFFQANGYRILDWGPDNHTYWRPVSPFRWRGLVRRSLAPLVELAGLRRAWQFYFLCERRVPEPPLR